MEREGREGAEYEEEDVLKDYGLLGKAQEIVIVQGSRDRGIG